MKPVSSIFERTGIPGMIYIHYSNKIFVEICLLLLTNVWTVCDQKEGQQIPDVPTSDGV